MWGYADAFAHKSNTRASKRKQEGGVTRRSPLLQALAPYLPDRACWACTVQAVRTAAAERCRTTNRRHRQTAQCAQFAMNDRLAGQRHYDAFELWTRQYPCGPSLNPCSSDKAPYFFPFTSISVGLRVASGFGKLLFPQFLFLGSTGHLDLDDGQDGQPWWAGGCMARGGRTAPSYCRASFFWLNGAMFVWCFSLLPMGSGAGWQACRPARWTGLMTLGSAGLPG